jgi:hypothetical protein
VGGSPPQQPRCSASDVGSRKVTSGYQGSLETVASLESHHPETLALFENAVDSAQPCGLTAASLPSKHREEFVPRWRHRTGGRIRHP